jgi:hypothetical protein
VSKKKDESCPVYVPPALKLIGSVSMLTLGPTGGPQSDGIFPHHGSAWDSGPPVAAGRGAAACWARKALAVLAVRQENGSDLPRASELLAASLLVCRRLLTLRYRRLDPREA